MAPPDLPTPAITQLPTTTQPGSNKKYTQKHSDALTPWRREALPGPATIDTLGEHG
jgi:hypothetical protein